MPHTFAILAPLAAAPCAVNATAARAGTSRCSRSSAVAARPARLQQYRVHHRHQRRGTGRGAAQVASAFTNPFAKKQEASAEEEELEEEEEDAVDGNPFASGGNEGAGAVDTESKPSGGGGGFKLPSLGGFSLPSMNRSVEEEWEEQDERMEEFAEPELAKSNPFASFGASIGDRLSKIREGTVDLEEVEEEEEITEPAANPFASFGASISDRFNKSIDRTIELEEEEEEEEAPAKQGNPFAGFSLPALPVLTLPAPAKKQKKPSAAATDRGTMGNWERTIKEGIRDGDIPTWNIAPESVKGTKVPKIKLKTGDVKVVGRDKGPGIDIAAKVACVSSVHCQFEMEGNKLYVTDLGSTNGTYVDGQEIRKNNRFRVFNGASVRLGAANRNGEPFVTFQADLTGANEMDRNSEYGQVQAIIEGLGGPSTVVNFLFINVAFQVGP